jgi:hypothetical protein
VKLKRDARSANAAAELADVDDARHLAMEIAGLEEARTIDPIEMRAVLEPGESAWRRLRNMWFRQAAGGKWGPAWPCEVLATNQRLLLRLSGGRFVSLWWGSVVGFSPDLAGRHVVLDYGDGAPRAVSGPGVALIAVVGTASLYGVEALMRHPDLAPLRQTAPDPG